MKYVQFTQNDDSWQGEFISYHWHWYWDTLASTGRTMYTNESIEYWRFFPQAHYTVVLEDEILKSILPYQLGHFDNIIVFNEMWSQGNEQILVEISDFEFLSNLLEAISSIMHMVVSNVLRTIVVQMFPSCVCSAWPLWTWERPSVTWRFENDGVMVIPSGSLTVRPCKVTETQ